MDAWKAFGSAQHSSVLEALDYIGVPGWLSAAITRHHRRGTAAYTNGSVLTK